MSELTALCDWCGQQPGVHGGECDDCWRLPGHEGEGAESAEIVKLRAENKRLREAATHAYDCLDSIYQTFDVDLGVHLSGQISNVCKEIKHALSAANG